MISLFFNEVTKDRNTATFLGHFCCAAFISVSAHVIIWQDWCFAPDGLYTIYQCNMYLKGLDHKTENAVYAIRVLNLVAIVWFHSNNAIINSMLVSMASQLFPALLGIVVNHNCHYGPMTRSCG